MRRRNNPWPAFSDLFSLLMLVTLGSAAIQYGDGGYGSRDPVWKQVQQLSKTIRRELSKSSIAIDDCSGQAAEDQTWSGNSTCLDLKIGFALDKADIPSRQRAELRQVCGLIKNSLDSLEKGAFEVVIEGHTDRTQPSRASSRRARYLYNWRLSSERAHSVLYEFANCGLKRPSYRIVSLGYADSRPKCLEDSPRCNQQNRRTTLKLVVPYESLQPGPRSTAQRPWSTPGLPPARQPTSNP